MSNGYPNRVDYHDPRGAEQNVYMRPRYSPDNGHNDDRLSRHHPQYESARHYNREPFQRDNSQYYSTRDEQLGYQNDPVVRRRPPPLPRHQPRDNSGYYSDDVLRYRDDERRYQNDYRGPHRPMSEDSMYQKVRPPPPTPPPSQASGRPYYSDSDYIEPHQYSPSYQTQHSPVKAFPPPPPPQKHYNNDHFHNEQRHNPVPLYVPQPQSKIITPSEVRVRPPVTRTPVNASQISDLDSPRAEVVVPNVRGVGTLAHIFEKSARIVQKELETPPKPPPKPLFYRDEHRDRLREIEDEVNRQRPQYDYDYSAVDHSRTRSNEMLNQYPPHSPDRSHQHKTHHQYSPHHVHAPTHHPVEKYIDPMDVYVQPPAQTEMYSDHDYELPPPISPPPPVRKSNQSNYAQHSMSELNHQSNYSRQDHLSNNEPHAIHHVINQLPNQQPVIHHPVVPQPVVHHPVVPQPVVHHPVVQQPVVNHPVVHHPVVRPPVIHHPVVKTQETVITPHIVDVLPLAFAKRANSGTQTLPEPKEVQTETVDDHEMYANRDTLNIADYNGPKHSKPLPPRPKNIQSEQKNILRHDSKTGWSDASDFHYQPSPDHSTQTTLTHQYFNHEYEENVSVDQSLPKQRRSHPLDPESVPTSSVKPVPKSVSFDDTLAEEDLGQDRKSGRMFKFVVKGPTEHAKFTVPFVDTKPQPQPNAAPRRSTEIKNQHIYNGAKPGPRPKPETPVPRVRRKSSADRPEIPRKPPIVKPPIVKPPSPVKTKPVAKWKEPPLVTSKSAKNRPNEIRRYAETPKDQTEPREQENAVYKYNDMLLQFRDKNSGANIQLPTEQPVKPSKKKEIKTDYESDSRAGRMRDKARRNRSVDHLDRLDESHSRKKSKSRGRSSSRQRTSSKSRGRSSSKRRDSSSSSDRSVKKSRGRSKSRRKESSSSDDSRHKKGRGRSKSRRRSSSSDKKRSKRFVGSILNRAVIYLIYV